MSHSNRSTTVEIILVLLVIALNSCSPTSTPIPTTIPPTINPMDTVFPTNKPLPANTHTPTHPPPPTATFTLTPALTAQSIAPENADQLILLTQAGKGFAQQVVYSQDGKLLIVSSTVGVYLYDAHTLDELKLITSRGVNCIALAPDSQILATGSTDSKVRLRRVSDGALLRVFEGHKGVIMAIAFAPDGQTLASSGGYYSAHASDNTIRLWRVSDGSLVDELEGHTDVVFSLAFTPDKLILASGSRDSTVRLWQVSNGKMLSTLWGEGGILAISPDGKMLAMSAINGQMQLRRLSDGNLLRILPNSMGYVFSLAFSGDNQILAAGWSDTWLATGTNAIQFWQVSDGTLLRSSNSLEGRITSLVFSPEGQTLASREGGAFKCCDLQIGAVRLWQVSDGILLHTLEGYNNFIRYSAFSSSGQYLVDEMRDGKLQWWQVNGDKVDLLKTLNGDLGGDDPLLDDPDFRNPKIRDIFKLALAADGQTLASGGVSKAGRRPGVRLWSLGSGKLMQTLDSNTDTVEVFGLAFTPDGQTLAVSYRNSPTSTDNPVRLWRVNDGKLLFTLTGHPKPVYLVVFSPDGRNLATASGDGTIRVWEADSGVLLNTIKSSGSPQAIEFSHDGQTLAGGLMNGEVQMWRVNDGALLTTLKGQTAGNVDTVSWDGPPGISQVTTLAFTPDGKLIAVGSYADNVVRLWRVSDGVLLRELKQDKVGVSDLKFTFDGRILIVGMIDGTINLWGTPPR